MIIPIIGLFIAANVGSALTTTWAEDNPLPLLMLNSSNRVLVLTTNQLDAFTYYAVGGLRLLLSDPLFFLLGYWYGDVAIKWVERRAPIYGELLRSVEGWFGKAAYPLVFIAPNNYICLFAGASGMSLVGFAVTNVVGTFTRLYLLRRFGEAFEEPIDDVLGVFADYRIPLLVLSFGIIGGYLVVQNRKGTGEIAALRELEDELDAQKDVEPDGDAG